VTDAHLALGRLNESSFLGGSFRVDAGASLAALQALGLRSLQPAARGVIDVANTVMAKALRVVSVERGHDAADFSLLAFGGSGPLHACELAEALRIRRVLVPPYPGVLSAMGMIWADAMRDYSTALTATLRPGDDRAPLLAELRKRLDALAVRAHDELGASALLEPAVDLRYAGQGYELSLPWRGSIDDLLAAFHAEHAHRYGHAGAGRPVEAVTLRLRARVPREHPPEPSLPEGPADAAAALVDHRTLALDKPCDAAVYDRARLLAGNEIAGPAIVSQLDSTTLVLPGWQARVDLQGNLVMEAEG
jgi:N-methylhydantoinase A